MSWLCVRYQFKASFCRGVTILGALKPDTWCYQHQQLPQGCKSVTLVPTTLVFNDLFALGSWGFHLKLPSTALNSKVHMFYFTRHFNLLCREGFLEYLIYNITGNGSFHTQKRFAFISKAFTVYNLTGNVILHFKNLVAHESIEKKMSEMTVSITIAKVSLFYLLFQYILYFKYTQKIALLVYAFFFPFCSLLTFISLWLHFISPCLLLPDLSFKCE